MDTHQDKQKLKNLLKKVIYFWAFWDVITVILFFYTGFLHSEIPIYSLLITTIGLFETSSDPFGTFTTVLLLTIQISIFFSAYYLLKQDKYAIYICYFQAPIRWFIGYSSIPIVNVLFSFGTDPSTIITTIEVAKLVTIVLWHRTIILAEKGKKGDELNLPQ